VGGSKALRPMCGSNVQELRKLVHSHSPAPGREHVMGQVTDIVTLAVVGAEEGFNVGPRGLDFVCMSARTPTNEAYAVGDHTRRDRGTQPSNH
jgi:hypothetical protein